MPVPLSEIVAGELVAVLTTLMLPLTAPTAIGAKLAVKARDGESRAGEGNL